MASRFRCKGEFAAVLGSLIGGRLVDLARKSRSPRIRFGGKFPGRVLLAHGERRETSAAKWGPHVSRPGREGVQAERRGKGGGALGRANGPGRERKKIARWKSWAAGSDFQGLLPFFFLFFFFNSFFQKSF